MDKIANNYGALRNHFYPMKKLQNYIHMGVIRDYRKGDSIVLPGELIDRIVYVLSGKLSISFLNEDGRKKIMFYADPYTFSDRLFPVDPCAVHVVSVENSTVCFFSKEQLSEIFQMDKEVIFEFITSYSSKCSYFMRETNEIALYGSSVRVLRLLYDLCLNQGKLVDGVYQIDVKLSQKSISEMTGIHYVTVCKLFGYLRKANILHKTTNKITVFDLQGLENLMNNWMKMK
ncbi:Transcriptional regulator, Crp [Dehalobacter sp. UNSWDHB]|uniref:Crp/Fnr family transcriptional regulator n=1 Tax=Dehalobacter sp. UNSWDHB TaxID=1339256 RepID=UPI0003878E51|nr:helix-turn-helix domain-containing protein [Dehalobacter sp. UNSWDHB]EQB21428.1 Transcriptional regulator, Crp [Dehalobacter sp. UNSWDHB]